MKRKNGLGSTKEITKKDVGPGTKFIYRASNA